MGCLQNGDIINITTVKLFQKKYLANFLYALLFTIIGAFLSFPFALCSNLIANNLQGHLVEKLTLGIFLGLIFAPIFKSIYDNKIFKSPSNSLSILLGYVNGYASGYGVMLTYSLEISTTNLIVILSIFIPSNILIFILFLRCLGMYLSMQDLYQYLIFNNSKP